MSEIEIEQFILEQREKNSLSMGICGVYAIFYIPTRKWYIGSSNNFRLRWKKHRLMIRKYNHHSYKFTIDLKRNMQQEKDPVGDCYFIIIEHTDEDSLEARELHWISILKGADYGYNVLTVDTNTKRVKHSEETNKKRSNTLKAIGHKPSEYCMQRMREERKTHVYTDEERKAHSDRMKGRTLTEEHKAKVGAFFKNKVLSDEHKAKLSAAKKGKVMSEEHKAKLSKPRGNLKKIEVWKIAKIKYALLNRNGRTNKQIAEEYEVPTYIITNIVTKNQYKNVQPEV
jgi:group I intron endonuclease